MTDLPDTSPNLGLPFYQTKLNEFEVQHNEALLMLDALVMLAVKDRDLSAPPPTPALGDRYLVKATGTGGFASQDNRIAQYDTGGWNFYAPQPGWTCYVQDELVLLAWDGSAWLPALDVLSGGAALQNLSLLGIGTTADSTNPVSAKLNNVLWAAKTVANGGDGTLRYKLSKEDATKTLSFLFQDNFSGRAEIGLTGDDDLHFKTSADGSAWNDALTLDRTSGGARLNSTVSFTADITPSQITADQNDYNPAGLSSASVLRLSTDTLRRVTGLQGGADGRILAVANTGSNPLVLSNASASSSAANRFDIAADLAIAPSEGAILMYDATALRWRLLAPRANARERLMASRTYYVRTDGNDSNSGLANTSAGAFLTIQKAIDTAASLDLSVYSVTINVADGTYSGGMTLKSYLGVGPISIVGNTSNWSNVTVSVTSGFPVIGSNIIGPYSLSGMKLVATTTGYSTIYLSGPTTYLSYANVEFGAANAHVSVALGATAVSFGATRISGGANVHWSVATDGKIQDAGQTITFVSAPAFVQAFAYVQQDGLLICNSNTFSTPSCTVSIASPGVVTYTGHNMAANAPFAFATTGALPTGITAGTTYYVKTVIDANTFTFSASAGGAAINTSGTQSGTHSIVPTGTRYSVATGGTIDTFGAGASYLPGNAAGSGGTTSGGGFFG